MNRPSELFSVEGKRVLVTGAARGIGRMLAQGFVERGAVVYITSRDEDGGRRAAAELSRQGTCSAIIAGLDDSGLREITEHLAASEERLDVLINNAGISFQAGLSDYPDSAFPEASEINLAAPFHLIRELLPLLRAGATESNPSKVINIGSVGAINFRLFNNFAYTASKAGLHAVSRQLAIALARDHITVNVIAPGPFRTEMMDNMIRDQGLETIVRRVPMHRLGEHDDVVGAAVYLASQAGNFVTASILRVDGGVSNVSA